jgi:hypothetical protein
MTEVRSYNLAHMRSLRNNIYVSTTVGNSPIEVVPANDKRLSIIFSAFAITTQINVATYPNVTTSIGIALKNAAGFLNFFALTAADYGALVRSQWYAVSAGGTWQLLIMEEIADECCELDQSKDPYMPGDRRQAV